MATRREYLVSLGLAKEGRGKFSTEAHTALAAARDEGKVFDDDPTPPTTTVPEVTP